MRNADDSPRQWSVAFAPGQLKAVASENGRVLATQVLKTAGPAAAIKLESNTSSLGTSWDDVAVVRATVVDANGIPVPLANNVITFETQGGGVVVATDNGENEGPRSFQLHQCHAFQGQCAAFVKASDGGEQITLSAQAAGLAVGTLIINTTRTP